MACLGIVPYHDLCRSVVDNKKCLGTETSLLCDLSANLQFFVQSGVCHNTKSLVPVCSKLKSI